LANSLCVYGPTGSRKTTQGKYFARYIAKTTGKATLLLSLSGGGWSPMCDPEVSAGMIIPYKADATITPLLLLRKISQGYWPAYPAEMNEGLAKAKATGNAVPEASLIPIDWNKIGGLIVEDWTNISSVIMRYLPDNGISVGGENRMATFKNGASSSFQQAIVVNGEFVSENFGSNILTDYGFVQNTLAGLVNNFNSLPVKSVMHTALEGKTTEDGEKNRAAIFGPAIDGKKATAQCGSWVGDLIHAQDYPLPVTTKIPNPSGDGEIDQVTIETTVRFFFTKHPDPDTNILFPAKPRCAPEKVMELRKRMPGGYFEPEFGADWGIDRYLELMDELAADAGKSESLSNWRERADMLLGRK
jgi:hypothetical protein